MSKSVRCIIVNCRSNAFKDLDVKFFKFPPRDSRLYNIWVDICYVSANAIRKDPRPYICSKHFCESDISFQGLAPNALPALKLNNSLRRINKSELTSEQMEKIRLVKLLNDTVLEWARRSQHYSLVDIPKSDLIKAAKTVRKMLGPKLSLSLDNYWCHRMRKCLSREAQYEKSSGYCYNVDLEQIIRELDPSVTIFTEKMIETSESKPEPIKLLQSEQSLSSKLAVLECLNKGAGIEISQSELTTEPYSSEDGFILGSPNFSGKRCDKKAKSYNNIEANKISSTYTRKQEISYSKSETNSSSKICDNYDPQFNCELRENSNKNNTSYPPMEIKNEVMDTNSEAVMLEFDVKSIKVEANNQDVSVKSELGQDLNGERYAGNSLLGLKVQDTSNDDITTVQPDYTIGGFVDEVSKDTVFEFHVIAQPDCKVEKVPTNADEDTFIEYEKPVKLECSADTIPEKDTKDKSFVNDRMVQPEGNVQPVIASNVNEVATTVFQNKPRSNESYINYFLNYINSYDKLKPKSHSQAFKSVILDGRRKHSRLHVTSIKEDNNQLEIQSKKPCPSSDSHLDIELEKSIDQTKIDSIPEKIDPQRDLLEEIQYDDDYNTNLSSDSSLNVEPDNNGMGQSKTKFNRANESPTDSLLTVKSNEKDPICFDGYWNSDDSISSEIQSTLASYTEALEYLKPLEDFVLRQEDYRAIGLVSNLEIHFKQRAQLQQQKM